MPRSSKHGHGRKPLYKEHGRETVRSFASERKELRSNDVPIHRSFAKFKVAPKDPELLPLVQAYLAKRRAELTSQPEIKPPSKSPDDFAPRVVIKDHARWVDSVGISQRDLLIQLMIDRKIHAVHFASGRIWQHYMEKGTLQPNVSINPIYSHQAAPYQADGEITEKQYGAMQTRKIIERACKKRGREFLDRVLQPDFGYAELKYAHPDQFQIAIDVLRVLLDGLSIVFRTSTGVNGVYGIWQKARDELRDWRIRNALQYRQEGQPNIDGLLRYFDYEDQLFVRGITTEIKEIEASEAYRFWRSPDQTMPEQTTRIRRGFVHGRHLE